MECLVEGPRGVVQEVLPERDVKWIQDAPFLVDEMPLRIHHAEPDCLYGDVGALKPGSVVWQCRRLGDLASLFNAFCRGGDGQIG